MCFLFVFVPLLIRFQINILNWNVHFLLCSFIKPKAFCCQPLWCKKMFVFLPGKVEIRRTRCPRQCYKILLIVQPLHLGKQKTYTYFLQPCRPPFLFRNCRQMNVYLKSPMNRSSWSAMKWFNSFIFQPCLPDWSFRSHSGILHCQGP